MIFLRRGQYREKERSRWSLLSFDTERQDWRGLADLYPVSAGGSEREVREKKAGDGQAFDQRTDQQTEKRTKRRGKASGINTDTEKTVGIKGGGFSRIYIGGKEQYRNALTNAGILEDAMLFSTLDTTTRSLVLDNTQEILVTDTVGFIRKLPHHLVEAFKSTLEEAKYADIIIHVVDASNPQMDEQMHVVYDTLRQLGAADRPVITLFNKQDKLESAGSYRDFQAEYSIPASAKQEKVLQN